MGLRVTDRRVDDLSWDFGSRDAFAAVVRGRVRRMDVTACAPEEGSAFVTDVVDAYAAETGSDHVFRFTQLVGKLTKP